MSVATLGVQVRGIRGFQTVLFQLVFSVAPTFVEVRTALTTAAQAPLSPVSAHEPGLCCPVCRSPWFLPCWPVDAACRSWG